MDYIERMELEIEELDKKIGDNKIFLDSEAAKELLDTIQRDLLATQTYYMMQYSFMLKMRLDYERKVDK